ncbi:hypothetical protein [Algibacillus agarilyticus]|uniref:hypothetical protein n=1 Tax=Algibacillus agarilyticus TaxID=2234133 RepID=UPI000DCF6D40|nr:hypothetical protein [Algibacillus agarilyticus]
MVDIRFVSELMTKYEEETNRMRQQLELYNLAKNAYIQAVNKFKADQSRFNELDMFECFLQDSIYHNIGFYLKETKSERVLKFVPESVEGKLFKVFFTRKTSNSKYQDAFAIPPKNNFNKFINTKKNFIASEMFEVTENVYAYSVKFNAMTISIQKLLQRIYFVDFTKIPNSAFSSQTLTNITDEGLQHRMLKKINFSSQEYFESDR